MAQQIRIALIALGVGVALTAAMAVMILKVTNDMRWVLVLGAVGFFAGAAWLGRRRAGVVLLALLCFPLLAVFFRLVVPQLPGLWPHALFWVGFALVGWWGSRSESFGAGMLAVLALLAGAATWYAVAYVPGEISRTLNEVRDDPAPEYRFVSLVGDPYPMESLDGKVVVIDFFATWCAPCIAELPEIDALYNRYAASPDVEIFIVANDSGNDTPESIQAFVEGRGLDVPFLYDPEGKAHKAFGFAGLPGLVVIDGADRIRFTREGYNAAETDFLENLVELVESLRANGAT